MRAGVQTAGRGRLGRQWTSPAGNLHASTLVRLTAAAPPAATLALVAAVALHDVFAAAGLASARIKWPNDLMLDGAKLAGILLERSGEWIVIGFGANLGAAPDVPGRRATCAADHLPFAPDPGQTVTDLARALDRRVALWRDGGVAAVIEPWLARAHAPGTPLSVRNGDAVIDGSFDGLTSDGALRLRLADGAQRVIHAGDVFLV